MARSILGLALGLLLISGVGVADDFIGADLKGAKDPVGIKRVEGSVILHSESTAFDEYGVALERVEFDYNAQAIKPWKKEKAEGKHEVAFYRMPKDVTTLEPLRSYEDELTALGFEVLFKGAGEELDNGYGRFVREVYGKKITGSLMEYILPAASDFRYIALKKGNEDGSVTYFTGLFSKTPASWGSKYSKEGDVLARVDVVTTKALTKRLVLVKAEEMAAAIGQSGRVALYGILFDFNKAEIKAESDETLGEIAKFLKDNPEVKVVVTGHTDNVGGFEFNRSLSERRAEAVVGALMTRYGIDKARLFPFGASFSSPVASNDSEEGKAKNRRVELVKSGE